jgi:hypothetical protein
VIKSDEVVDMRARNKDVFEALDLARRQIRYIAEIKHDRTPFKQRLDIGRRIAGSPIDQNRMQKWSHETDCNLRHAVPADIGALRPSSISAPSFTASLTGS